jgi:hypothetical protein
MTEKKSIVETFWITITKQPHPPHDDLPKKNASSHEFKEKKNTNSHKKKLSRSECVE